MVSKNQINKSVDEAIFKCSPSAKARSIGASVQESTYTNNNGEKVTRYDYGEGISVELTDAIKHMSYEDGSGEGYDVESTVFSNITWDGKNYPILSRYSQGDADANSFFKHQKEEIISKYGEEGWSFYKEYSNEFGTCHGWELNSYLRGEKTITDIQDNVTPFLLENHTRFVEMEKNLSLDKEDFVSIRIIGDLHRNDSIGKKIVSDNAHTSSSIVGEKDHYATYANPDTGWFILTLNDKGSGVKGGYLASAIEEYDGYDFEREVNYVPNQKFERLVMDEKNKIIIQRPLPLEE